MINDVFTKVETITQTPAFFRLASIVLPADQREKSRKVNPPNYSNASAITASATINQNSSQQFISSPNK